MNKSIKEQLEEIEVKPIREYPVKIKITEVSKGKAEAYEEIVQLEDVKPLYKQTNPLPDCLSGTSTLYNEPNTEIY